MHSTSAGAASRCRAFATWQRRVATTPPNPPKRDLKACSASTKYKSLLPPSTSRRSELVPVKPGLWMIAQEFGAPNTLKFDLSLNMVVAMLDDGTLWVAGPVTPTQEVLQMIDSLAAPVSHIVLPNNWVEHVTCGPDLASKFPAATVWAVPDMMSSKEVQEIQKTNTVRVIREQGMEGWPEDVEVVLYSGPYLEEAALYLPRYNSVFLADLATATYNRKAIPLDIMLIPAEWFGIYKQLGSVAARLVFPLAPDAAAAFMRKILRWDFDTVLSGHLDPATPANKVDLANAFRFLNRPLLE